MSRLIYLLVKCLCPHKWPSKPMPKFKAALCNEAILEMLYDNKICFEGMSHAMLRMSSCVVDTLRGDVPDYLYGRPHWFVRHCVSRLH